MLNKHAPLKKKALRANHAPYVTKTLKKANMKRSYLQKLFQKKKETSESLKKYKKRKNFCSSLYKITLDVNKTTDNKAF